MVTNASIGSWDSILSLVVFFLANAAVIFPFQIPIPIPNYVLKCFRDISIKYCLVPIPHQDSTIPSESNGIVWTRLTANFQTVPLISVLFLLATTAIDKNVVREGILGINGVQPLDILALFISLAYLTVSLDNAGLFRYSAFWVARKGGSSINKLYVYFYVFFITSGVILGNDPVILSGTPFIAYFTRISGINPPTPWTLAQFAAANTASAVLPPSNQTNLVLTGAFAITFFSFAAHTVLPVLAASIAVFIVLKLMFRSLHSNAQEVYSHELEPNEISHRTDGAIEAERSSFGFRPSPPDSAVLVDKNGAIIGSILLGVTLIVLVCTSTLKIPLWEITVPPAVIMIARDIYHDYSRWRLFFKHYFLSSKSLKAEAMEPSDECQNGACANTCPNVLRYTTTESYRAICGPLDFESTRTLSFFLTCSLNCAFPTVSTNIRRLPVALIPFALCMFILVEGLVSKGWVDTFGSWWNTWMTYCESSGGESAQVGSAIFSMLTLTVLLCNICGTNIGATILLARLLQIWQQNSDSSAMPISERTRVGSIYALALGSNFGAYSFSFSASLAGLLWRSILSQKGIQVKQSQFTLLNLPIVFAAVAVSGAVLLAEVYVVHG